MNELERMLGDELSSVERGVTAPVADVAGLVAAGRRERRRRTGFAAAAGAAAAVVATVGVLAVVPSLEGDSAGPPPAAPGRTDAPTSDSDLPVGATSTAPYLGDGVLHAAGTTARFDSRDGLEVHFAAGLTTATLQRDGRWRALLLRDGQVVELAVSATASAVPAYRLLPSADGRHVALAHRVSSTRVEVTLYDGDGGFVGSQTYAGAQVRDSFSLLNVTADGRVVTSTDRFLVWGPGGPPVEVTGLGGVAAEEISYPGGLLQDVEGSADGGTYGSISDGGRFEAVGETGQDDVAWAPAGEVWVYVPYDAPTQVVVEGEGRGPDVLPLPTDQGWQVVGWESDTAVVLESPASTGRWAQARCDVDTLACERVPLED